MRWCDIGSCLPQVPLYVREVIFEPELKSIAVENEASWQTPVEGLEQFVFHELEIISNPSDIQLPDMPQVHKLVWNTPLHLSLPTFCTPETRQFISTFCFLKEVEFTGRFATVSDAKEFLGLLSPIEVLNIKGIDIDETGSSGQSPVFTGDMTNLRRLSLEECIVPLDWLVDDILAVSCPANLRSMRYKDTLPFSQKAFTCLLTLSSESLQELIIQPPSDGGTFPGGWGQMPHFTNQAFPSLMSLTFCIIPLGLPLKSLFSMNWCRRVIEVFPPALKMTSLTMHFYAIRPEDADEIAADQSFECRQLSELTSDLFPELKRFVIRISMEVKFGVRLKALLEALLKERLEHFGNTLVIEWVDENPHLSGDIDWDSE
ncbi:hypothetical protein ARMSODRAFT_962670 [Armillaria solidipes]|uniref:F-box domain-containing protein n=1 Tax=Armillaria solidipes TaxID=1076256 RepID=A0A2H3BJ80_9AGAR|nr:hypothetical protein ARMSODRAFT_962670 [Armillaria solidipes]